MNKPNIVFVFGDQWRHSAVGYAGNPDVKTPRIDELASRSLRFTHAVSGCPVSTPARASLLTGQYPHRHGLFLNDAPLRAEQITSVAHPFRDAGYDTGYIGKWHVDGPARSGYIPPSRRLGFDYWAVLNCTHSYFNSWYYRGDSDERLQWEGYDAYAQTDDACRYIAGQGRDAGKPFVLFLSWGPPHDPYGQAPQEMLAMYDPASLTLPPNVPPDREAQARKELRGYYAHVSALDRCVGRLIDTLKAAGQYQNTLFVLTSDHGDMLESHGQFNKQRPWDEALRIPMLMHWPDRFGTEGRDLDCLIDIPDLMPTLVSLAGLPIPGSVQGLDYAAHLVDGAAPPTDCALYACYVPFGLWTRWLGGRECRGVRTRTHTYVRDLCGPFMLFDNQADPCQQHNLIGQRGSVPLVKELDARLQEKLAAVDDDFLPAHMLIERWGYLVNREETIDYT